MKKQRKHEKILEEYGDPWRFERDNKNGNWLEQWLSKHRKFLENYWIRVQGNKKKKKPQMGRRKLEIKRIEEKSCREVAFCKRRKGLIKKANQLSILCDVDVALVIISNRGRLHEFSSTNSLTEMLQRYEAEKEISAEIQAAEHTGYSSMTTGELLQETERQLEETNADGLTVTELIHLENELQTALMQIRSRKTHLMHESIKALHEKGKLLRKEKKHLQNNMKKNRKVNEMSDLPPPRMTLNFL